MVLIFFSERALYAQKTRMMTIIVVVMYHRSPMVFLVVQIMAISGIIETKFIAKVVILSELKTALNKFIICKV